MRFPQIVIVESDGWIAKQFREMAGESRWLVKPARSTGAALSLIQRQPAVLLVQFEPAEDKSEPLGLIAEVHRLAPDVPVIAVADVKVSDTERTAWTAALLDLGARYVLFPPLTKPVLEDVVSGLMSAAIRRTIGGDGTRSDLPGDIILDLANEGAEA